MKGWVSCFELFFPIALVPLSNSYGPDHSKTEPLEIQTKWHFCADFQWFWTKWGSKGTPLENRMQLENQTPLENQTEGYHWNSECFK